VVVAVAVEHQMVLAAQARPVKVMLVGGALLMEQRLHPVEAGAVLVAQGEMLEIRALVVTVVMDNHHQLAAHP
jgi:hypothetical protein